MGQSSSNLSKFGIPNKEKLEYERFYDKINLRETKLYEKFVEHTTNNETIVLKFKDKHGTPKFMLEIFENLGGNPVFQLFKINKVFRPDVSLNMTKLTSNQLTLTGRWNPTGFYMDITINDYSTKERSFDIQMIIRNYNLDKERMDENLYWSRIKIKEYYIFKKES